MEKIQRKAVLKVLTTARFVLTEEVCALACICPVELIAEEHAPAYKAVWKALIRGEEK